MTKELVQAGAVELSVEQRGDGDAVVLVAGGFMDMDQWEAQMDALGGPYRVIRFDHRGVGESEKPTEGYSIEQLAADTAALITALDAGPCVLWGNSLGGLVALEVALRFPETVRALVLSASSAGAKGEPTPQATQNAMFAGAALPVEQVAEALMHVLFATSYPSEHPEAVQRAVRKRQQHPGPMIASMGPLQSAMKYEPLGRLGEVTAPALILHGEEDRLIPVANARLLGEALPNAEVVIVERAGHALVVEASATVNAAVEGFISGL